MNFLIIAISIIATMFSSAVLAYISIATMMGPWMAPTIVLIAGALLRLQRNRTSAQTNVDLALIQTAGSVGGIVATAVGFTLPTLFFLDRVKFEQLLAQPIYFCTIVGAICLAAGSLGLLMGRAFKTKLLVTEKLEMPVSEMIHKTITSQSQGSQAKQLIAGISISALIGFIRDGVRFGAHTIIPRLMGSKQFFLFQSLVGRHAPIMISPMLWAIGFLAGIGIALPLLVGMLSKYLVMYPINHHSLYLPIKLFPVLGEKEFSMAFASGLVLAGVVPLILKYPKIIWDSLKHHSDYSYIHRFSSLKNFIKKVTKTPIKLLSNIEGLIALTAIIALFSYFQFPFFAQLLILPLTVIAAYNVSFISGKIGLVTLGRFVTFVMLPTMLIFKLTPVQLTVLCVFVGSAMFIAADLLFGYKVGDLCDIDDKKIYRYQWLGVIITALCLGFFLWLLFTNLQLGTEQLFAQRGKSRALLIQSFSFNWTVLLLGLLFGLILKKLKVNPTMVFGGILMPNSLTIGLVIGALGTLLTKKKKELFPFFSGVFAAESIWMIVNILLGIV